MNNAGRIVLFSGGIAYILHLLISFSHDFLRGWYVGRFEVRQDGDLNFQIEQLDNIFRYLQGIPQFIFVLLVIILWLSYYLKLKGNIEGKFLNKIICMR